MTTTATVTVLAGLLVTACAPTLQAGPSAAVVSRVVDGDTVKLNTGDTVRVLGIDTPETVEPHHPVDCWGPQASAFAHATLDGKTVRVVDDPTQDAHDRYGRRLSYLILPGEVNYSVLAAEQGMAHAYAYRRNRPPRAYREIAAAEQRAQAAGKGLWGACPR